MWACVTLFMTANLLKTLIAKLLSSKFVRDSHTRKMHDSLKKVGVKIEWGVVLLGVVWWG